MLVKTLKKYLNILFPIATATGLLLLWLLVAKIIDKPIIMPAPVEAFGEFIKLSGTTIFWKAIFGTIRRALLSFLYAVIFASILSVLSKLSKIFESVIEPVITILRSVPTMSIILLTLIWLSSESSPMLIAFLITFPILYSNFLTSLKSVDGKLIEMSRVFKVGKKEMIKYLYVPAVLPNAFSSMKSTVSLSLKVTIASEVMAQTRLSMGVYMQQSMIFFDTAELFAWTLAAIVFSYLLELAVSGVKKLIVRW